jgi:serine/alanine adding enzyme
MRRESGNFDRLIRLWRRLPLPVTRWIGPSIVRGIP